MYNTGEFSFHGTLAHSFEPSVRLDESIKFVIDTGASMSLMPAMFMTKLRHLAEGRSLVPYTSGSNRAPRTTVRAVTGESLEVDTWLVGIVPNTDDPANSSIAPQPLESPVGVRRPRFNDVWKWVRRKGPWPWQSTPTDLLGKPYVLLGMDFIETHVQMLVIDRDPSNGKKLRASIEFRA